MSKLAHSHQPTMDALEIARAIEDGNEDLLPQPIFAMVTALKAIALAEGKLKNHPNYLTKYQMIRVARGTLKKVCAGDPA